MRYGSLASLKVPVYVVAWGRKIVAMCRSTVYCSNKFKRIPLTLLRRQVSALRFFSSENWCTVAIIFICVLFRYPYSVVSQLSPIKNRSCLSSLKPILHHFAKKTENRKIHKSLLRRKISQKFQQFWTPHVISDSVLIFRKNQRIFFSSWNY